MQGSKTHLHPRARLRGRKRNRRHGAHRAPPGSMRPQQKNRQHHGDRADENCGERRPE
jgi:hypothetical protein